jgi:hypothetical protein
MRAVNKADSNIAGDRAIKKQEILSHSNIFSKFQRADDVAANDRSDDRCVKTAPEVLDKPGAYRKQNDTGLALPVELGRNVDLAGKDAVIEDVSAFVGTAEIGEDPIEFRVGRERCKALLDMLRLPDVVAVEESYEVADCVLDPEVSGRRRSAVASIIQAADPFVLRHHTRHKLGSVVVAMVVDDEDIEMGMGLGKHRAQGSFQEGGTVKCRYDDCDERGWHSTTEGERQERIAPSVEQIDLEGEG